MNKWICRLVSIATAIVYCICIIIQFPINTVAEAADKVLPINWGLISQVGHQLAKSDACACYALAYCRTLLDNRVHYWTEYDGNGAPENQLGTNCDWSRGNYNRIYTTNKTKLQVFQVLYDSINQNRPAILRISGRGSSVHWVCIVGYTSGSDYNNLTENNFYMIDSAEFIFSDSHYYNLGNERYSILWDDSKGYGYATANSGSIPPVDPSESYISISGASAPTGDRKLGANFGVYGTITSNYPLARVWGGVYNADGTPTAQYCDQKPNSTSYNLVTYFDQHIIFDDLPVGDYVYRIEATDNQGYYKELIWSVFTVGGGTPIGKPVVKVSASDTGSPVTISYNACSNATHYDIRFYKSDDTLVWAIGYNDDAKKYNNLQEYTDTSYSHTFPAGSYYVTVAAVNRVTAKYNFSDKTPFTVTERKLHYPDKPVVTVSASDSDHPVVVSYNSCSYATDYCIRYYDSSNTLIYAIGDSDDSKRFDSCFDYTKTSHSYSLPAGKYKVRVASINGDDGVWTFSEYMAFTVTEPPASSITVSNESAPKGALTLGKGFDVAGTISSTYPLTKVWGGVYDSAGKATALYCEKKPNTKTFDLKSEFNSAFAFAKLERGSYTYKIEATDSKGVSKVLVSSAFTVEMPTPAKPTLTVTAGDSASYTVFSWTVSENAGNYNLRIQSEQDGTYKSFINAEKMTGTKYQTALSPGKYKAYVEAYNSDKTTLSDTVSFSVKASSLLTFEKGSTTATVVGCDNSQSSIVIPGRYDGLLVTTIGEKAFENCDKLESISFTSITDIAIRAFSYCQALKEISIPNCVKNLAGTSFYCCYNLEKVTIPASVTWIGSYAFSGCSGLKEIVVSGDNEKFVSVDNVLYSKDKTRLLRYAPAKSDTVFSVPQTVTALDPEAFNRAGSLTKILLPDSVTVIGDGCFANCIELTSIVIPNGVTKLQNFTFIACSSLKNIFVPESVTSIGDTVFTKDVVTVSGYSGSEIESYCKEKEIPFVAVDKTTQSLKFNIVEDHAEVVGCDPSETTVTIPAWYDGLPVTVIGEKAFEGCKSMTSVSLPDSITAIGSRAFSGCVGLTEIAIPDSVQTIAGVAFYDCSGLVNVTIPKSVKSMGSCVFSGCNKLSSIDVAPENSSFSSENGVLYNKDKTKLIKYIPGKQDTSFTVPATVTMIDQEAFSHSSNLTEIVIPDGATEIGEGSFSTCVKLTKIELPGTVTAIKRFAFNSCSELAEAIIPENVTVIGEDAFGKCPQLTIMGITGSTADAYSRKNDIRFIALDKQSGDVNEDGSVDQKDVTLMRRALAGWEVTINETNADVNADGSFDLKDVTILRRYLAGWDVTLA